MGSRPPQQDGGADTHSVPTSRGPADSFESAAADGAQHNSRERVVGTGKSLLEMPQGLILGKMTKDNDVKAFFKVSEQNAIATQWSCEI